MCNNNKYPCDIPDANGEFRCPYGAEFNSSGLACYNHCGLGADESEENFENEIPDEPEVDESMNPYDGTYDWQNDSISIGSEDW